MTITDRYKDFPPGWSHLKIPLSSRRAALAGLALYAPCRPTGVWLHRAAWLWVRLLGPWALPGRALAWQPAMDGSWLELSNALERALGPFDGIAGYLRAQTARSGMALLLLRRGAPIAFVKIKYGASAALTNETRAVRAVSAYGPRTFRVPTPLHSGSVSGWEYLAVAPMPVERHRVPTRPPLQAILEEVQAALSTFPRPDGVALDWRPMHGDFAPWNLRATVDGSLYLVDWESAGWGPADADEVFYRATEAALAERPGPRVGSAEAVRFWREQLAHQPGETRDRRLTTALANVLDQMSGREGG